MIKINTIFIISIIFSILVFFCLSMCTLSKLLNVMTTNMDNVIDSMEIGIIMWITLIIIQSMIEVTFGFTGIFITIYFIFLCIPPYFTLKFIDDNLISDKRE